VLTVAPGDTVSDCPLLGEFRADVLADLAHHGEEHGGHLLPSDWPLVVEYAKQLALLMRIDMVLEAEGTEHQVLRMVAKKPESVGQAWEVKGAGLDVHPLLALREQISGKVFVYAEQLGLSPMGRKKLELKGAAPKSVKTIEGIAAEKAEEAKKEGRE
jgi:phage terminase small subunit